MCSTGTPSHAMTRNVKANPWVTMTVSAAPRPRDLPSAQVSPYDLRCLRGPPQVGGEQLGAWAHGLGEEPPDPVSLLLAQGREGGVVPAPHPPLDVVRGLGVGHSVNG